MGKLLVMPANGWRVTIEETIAAIEEARNDRIDDIEAAATARLK